ncbi:MAG: hypothetical protein HY519_03075 [Candidatus Aenigmarchaeota archaeon]|nr:hypothetical protein [Candidatus Aenigmarchaeota archaeon]
MVNVNGVKHGELVVDGKSYYSDAIVWWDGTVEMADKFHVVGVDAMARLLSKSPEIIVIGLGINGSVTVEESATELAERKKVSFYAEQSAKAAELFNAFMAAGKKAVALIHTGL